MTPIALAVVIHSPSWITGVVEIRERNEAV
jgi:hypothetical protein